MRILYITHSFYPEVIGGGCISAYHIAKSVANRGHDVYVVALSQHMTEKQMIGNINVYRFKKITGKTHLSKKFFNLEGRYLNLFLQARKVIKKTNPDIVHLLNTRSIFFNSFYAKLKNIPVFATINAPIFNTKNGIYWKLNKLELKFFLSHAILLPVSNAIKTHLIEGGVDKSMDVVHNPVVLPREVSKHDNENILYAGRIKKDKGVHYIFSAIRRANAKLMLAGRCNYDGSASSYCRQLSDYAKKHSLNVKYHGFVEHNRMNKLYLNSAVTVLPCSFFEPLSRMLLESLSYGVPAIATDVGGNNEIIDDGVNGLLLEEQDHKILAEAIEYLIHNPELRIKMGLEGRKKIEKGFNPVKIGEQLEKIYKKY